MKLDEVLTKYQAWKSIRTEKASTDYPRLIKRFFAFIQKDLESIEIDDIIAYQSHLKKNYADNTQAIAAYALRSFFAFTNKRGVTDFDISEITAPKIEEKVPVYVVREDYEKLCEVAQYESPDILLAIKLLWFTGVRVSELCDIKVAEVDKIEYCATVATKKSKKPKVIMWDEDTDKLLRGVIRSNPQSEYVLTSPLGGKITTRSIERRIASVVKKAGITKHITPHSFRHGATKEWLDAGVDLPAIKDLLGHDHLMSVEKYTKRLSQDIKEIGREAVRRRSAAIKYSMERLLRS
jgi:site-specific recombinase XerD